MLIDFRLAPCHTKFGQQWRALPFIRPSLSAAQRSGTSHFRFEDKKPPPRGAGDVYRRFRFALRAAAAGLFTSRELILIRAAQQPAHHKTPATARCPAEANRPEQRGKPPCRSATLSCSHDRQELDAEPGGRGRDDAPAGSSCRLTAPLDALEGLRAGSLSNLYENKCCRTDHRDPSPCS